MQRWIIIFGLLVTAITSCSYRQSEEGTVPVSGVDVGVSVTRPPDEARIEDEIPEYEISSSTLADLQRLPAPSVLFLFDNEKKPLGEVSPKARQITEAHWKASLEYFYNEQFQKARNAQEQGDRMIEWARACNVTHQTLMKTEIAAPLGKRFISYTEAEKTFGFLNGVAFDVVRNLKNANESSSTRLEQY